MLASKLGWILTRWTSEQDEDTSECNMLISSYNSNTQKETNLLTPDIYFPTKPNLEEFWRLESIENTDSPVDSDNDKSIKLFNEILKYDNNKYRVTWSWKMTNRVCLKIANWLSEC